MSRRARLLLSAGLALAALLLAPSPSWSQCAMCKAAVANSEQGRALATSLNHAILLLLAAPYLTAGSIGLYLFRGRVRRRLARLAAFRSGRPRELG